MNLRAGAAGAIVIAILSLVVAVRAARAPAPPPLRHADATEQSRFADSVRESEPKWTDSAARNFPRDHWSARDDFHGMEADRARDLARKSGNDVESVLRAVDQDLHASPATGASDPRAARAVPCKPRPYYD